MNVINLFTRAYSKLQNYPGMPYWVLTPFRRIVRHVANMVLPWYLAKTHECTGKREDGVIVSFTSFPARINDVWQVVECMFRQTYQPAKIVLWLSKDQFPDGMGIPVSLREREGNIFEIRMVDGDIRSHKKYYYVAKEYPDSLIFLIDDDIYYPTDILELSMKAHEEYPEAIICNYGYHIRYKENGELMPYNNWSKEYRYSTGEDLFFGSGGGTLFKPSWLHKDFTNIELAIELTPIADDIWLNAMVNLAKLKKVLLNNRLILPIRIENNIRLATQNREEDRNDEQLQAVAKYYLNNSGINPFLFK